MEKIKQKEIHAKHFDKTKEAVENGYYLEAMVLEYSYIEARVNKIMNLLNMPCAIVQNHEVYRDIGLNAKLGCIQQFLKQDQLLFEKSKLTNKLINDIKKWCHKRNERIHNLYKDLDKYESLIQKNKEIAEDGYKYAQLMSEESNRLKRLYNRKLELFKNHNLKCSNGQQKELKASCIKAISIAKDLINNNEL